jgi:hypothetical protein
MKIPKVIVQTFSSRDKMTPQMVEATESWKNKNPDWEYKLFDNNECIEFIGKHFDKDTLEAFNNLLPGAFKGDLFRYCYLYVKGGVYTDIDNICLVPLSEFINPHDSFILVKDSVNHKASLYYNAFMATEKNNPVIKEAIDICVHNSINGIYPKTTNRIVDVLAVTGPKCLGSALEKHLKWANSKLRLFNVIEQQAKVGERFLVEIIGIATDNNKTVVKVKYDGYKETDDYWDLFEKRKIYKKVPKLNLNPLISCLCPTKNHPSIVIDAIMDFKKQTWTNKELILVTDEKSKYKDVLKYFERDNIKLFLAPHGSTIGSLRNISMEKAQGEYVATWDDDDGHHKDRLRIQHEAITSSNKKACFLKRVLVHDTITNDKGISKNWRGMEASMLALKSIIPRYDDLKTIAEDTPIKTFLAQNGHVTLIDEPQLYTYRFHSSNTCQRQHLLAIIDTII